jgi:nucleotide-binding universal stress UspA family protein
MFRHVLVPLDGSPFAEQALPWALSIARRAGACLDLARLMEARCTLLRVVESANERSDGAEEARAQDSLDGVAGRLSDQAAMQTRKVLAVRAAEGILEEARVLGSDLIALATHGRGGVRRMLLGSVADKVIRGCSIPILVCRPPQS